MEHIRLSLTNLLLLLLISSEFCDCTISNVFLNSHHHCGNDKTFEVSPSDGYLVMPDVSPDSGTKTFRDCEVTFHSAREHGNLCVSQEGSLSQILDSNAELSVYDGYGDDQPRLFTLEYFPSEWSHREACTNSPYLYFYIRRKDKSINVNVRELKLLFKVLDIESKERTLYFDENYCDGMYRLKNSWINVLNRLPPSPTSDGTEIKRICGFQFDKEPDDGRRMCFVYVPSSNVDCSSGWELAVSSKKHSLDRQFFVFSLACNESRARHMQIWCGSNTTHSYSLIMQRSRTIANLGAEPSNMFRLIITDHEGSERNLMEKVKAELATVDDDSEGLGSVFIVLIVALASGGILFVAAVVYKLRHKMPWYDPVHSEPKPEDV